MLNFKIIILLFLLIDPVLSLSQIHERARNNTDNISESKENQYFPLKRNGKWGFVCNRGWKKINYQFEEAYTFSNGLALVKKNNKYGFINSKGKFVIECEFDNARQFKNGYAWVKKNGLETLIKKNGDKFLNHWFVAIEPFSNGFAKVVFKNDSISNILNDKFIVAYVDQNGKQLSNRWYSGGSSFMNGKAKVSIANEFFYLDTLGQLEYRTCNECDEAVPYSIDHNIDIKAHFKGGDFELTKFIKENLNYPKAARKRGIQGTVMVQFLIDKHGKIINASIYQGIHPLIDKEAVKVIMNLPNWVPAQKNGEKICQTYVVPISFCIK